VALYDEQINPSIADDVQTVRATADQTANFSITLLTALGIAAALVGLTTAAVVTRSIAQPIRRLTDIAAGVSAGNLDVETAITSSDETGALAGAFDQMIAACTALRNEQEQRERLVRSTVALAIRPKRPAILRRA
jgi:nitrogen fixation/metabolism regulation signal transduction histidine kinase